MKPLKTLLIATDFSAAARRAEERAALLAAEHEARLIVLHSLSGRALQRMRECLALSHAGAESRLLEHYRAALQRQAEDLAARWRIEVTPRLVAGQAHREISRAAGDVGADLVVVGARGEHPSIAFFLGSTAERVVRESPAPVLVVRTEAREPYARVLAALDLTPHSSAVLEAARLVAPTASLTLGHAFEVPFEGKLQFAGASEEEIDAYRREGRAHALAALRALAEEKADQADIRVEHGIPDAVLLRLLRETSADLVVTGKHGGSEMIDLLLGSITKHLLRESGGDVLVAPPARGSQA